MHTNKIISVAIAIAMVTVSFAMVANNAFGMSTMDNSTTLTVNAKYPRLYWMGFNDTLFNSRMGQQVPVGTDYLFSLEYNYSFGSALCNFTVYAWYDGGAAPSTYPPAPGDNERNLAFQLDCSFAGVTNVVFPSGNLEVGSVGPASVLPTAEPTPVGEEHYIVFIPVTFGEQLRAAEVNGYGTYGDLGTALVTPGTWDFDVIVGDTTSSATNISYGEFGIQKFVSVTVTGNPTGNAPPGGNTGWMTTQSVITYSSNADYYVTVEIDDLVDTVTPIGAANVEVQNMHANATGNSEIDIATFFVGPAPGNPLYVWGIGGSPIAASNHGTESQGPLDSNYFGPGTTNLQWRVTVPGGTAEGVYHSMIYITVDNT